MNNYGDTIIVSPSYFTVLLSSCTEQCDLCMHELYTIIPHLQLEKKQYQNFWANELLLSHVAIIAKAYTGPIQQ